MQIPHQKLSPTALRAVVEEFVTRDGTDHTLVELRVEKVLQQLGSGAAQLHYDLETETTTIVNSDQD